MQLWIKFHIVKMVRVRVILNLMFKYCDALQMFSGILWCIMKTSWYTVLYNLYVYWSRKKKHWSISLTWYIRGLKIAILTIKCLAFLCYSCVNSPVNVEQCRANNMDLLNLTKYMDHLSIYLLFDQTLLFEMFYIYLSINLHTVFNQSRTFPSFFFIWLSKFHLDICYFFFNIIVWVCR